MAPAAAFATRIGCRKQAQATSAVEARSNDFMAELPSYRCGNNVSVRDFAYGAKTNTLQVNDVYHIHYVLFPVGAENVFALARTKP